MIYLFGTERINKQQILDTSKLKDIADNNFILDRSSPRG